MAAFTCRRKSFRSLQQIAGQAIALKPAVISIFYNAAEYLQPETDVYENKSRLLKRGE